MYPMEIEHFLCAAYHQPKESQCLNDLIFIKPFHVHVHISSGKTFSVGREFQNYLTYVIHIRILIGPPTFTISILCCSETKWIKFSSHLFHTNLIQLFLGIILNKISVKLDVKSFQISLRLLWEFFRLAAEYNFLSA